MAPSHLQLLLIVLASALLGAVITFSYFHATDLKLLMGSVIFSLALLLFLIVQLREITTEQ